MVLDNPEFSNFHNYKLNNLLFKFPILDYEYISKKYSLNFEKKLTLALLVRFQVIEIIEKIY